MKRIAALFLLPLCLTACGGGGGQEGLLPAAARIEAEAPLLTVDGREVPAWRYLYWLAYTCDYIQEAYAAAQRPLDWEDQASGGTLADYAKAQALEHTVLYATVENWAQAHGCSLTGEDRAAMEAEWTDKAASYGGEEAYLAALAWMGLDRERAEAMSEPYYLYSRLYDRFCTEGSGLYPAEEAVAAFAKNWVTADHIWISVEEGDDKEARRARAAEAFSKLNASAAPLHDFAVLAATYSDAPDRDQYPNGCTFALGAGVMPAAFEEAVQSLKEDQWSGVVEAEDGFYIILRRPLEVRAVYPDYFDSLLQSAAEEAEVVFAPAYEDLSAGSFSARLERGRERLEEP